MTSIRLYLFFWMPLCLFGGGILASWALAQSPSSPSGPLLPQVPSPTSSRKKPYPLPPASSPPSTPQKALGQRLKIWRQRLRLQHLQQKESRILDALGELDRKRLALEARFDRLRQQQKQLDRQVAQNLRHWKTHQAILQAMERRMRPRLRLLYRLVLLGRGRVLLGANNMKELARRWRALRQLTLHDMKLLRAYQRLRNQALLLSRRLNTSQERLSRLIRRLKKQHEGLLAARREKKIALSALYREAGAYQQAIRELRASGKRLNRMLGGLTFQRSWRSQFAQKKGQLPWPIPRYTPYCHRYTLQWKGSFAALQCQQRRITPRSLRGPLGRVGLTLPAPKGTPVTAVAAGRVVYTGWQHGYGNLLILDHGDRFHTLYAHLSRLGPRLREAVRPGQLIGLSGSSGSLGQPALYFEVRHMTRPLRPEEWLLARTPPKSRP